MTTIEILASAAFASIIGVYTLIGMTLIGDMRRKGQTLPEIEALKAQNMTIQEGLALVQQTLLAAMGKAKPM